MPHISLTTNPSESVSSFSEKELIKKVCEWFAPQVLPSPFGPGDDCAAISPKKFGGSIVSTCDAVILGRHLDSGTSAYLAGKKTMNRNISDIAAMGGIPLYAMTSCIMGANVSIFWLEEFCTGMRDAAKKHNVFFIGGDIAKGPDSFFSMHVNLLGDAKNPLLRSGAKAGDSIFVTGTLGASFESGKHLTFEPRVDEGLFLASYPDIGACTDLSDGLASDIRNIIPADCCAELVAEKIPLNLCDGNSLIKALSDGEDYELLFTAPADSDIASDFFARFGFCAHEIGKIKTAPDIDSCGAVFLNENNNLRELKIFGFSHF